MESESDIEIFQMYGIDGAGHPIYQVLGDLIA